MIESLFKIVETALTIWESKERRRYVDRLLEIKSKYYEENNKPRPNMAVLDNLEHDLKLFSEAFNSETTK